MITISWTSTRVDHHRVEISEDELTPSLNGQIERWKNGDAHALDPFIDTTQSDETLQVGEPETVHIKRIEY